MLKGKKFDAFTLKSLLHTASPNPYLVICRLYLTTSKLYLVEHKLRYIKSSRFLEVFLRESTYKKCLREE